MNVLLASNQPYTTWYVGANRVMRFLSEGLASRHHVRMVMPAFAVSAALDQERLREQLVGNGILHNETNGVLTLESGGVQISAVLDPANLRSTLLTTIEDFVPDCVIVSSEDRSQSLLWAALSSRPGRIIYFALTPHLLPFGPDSLYPGKTRTELIGQASAIICLSKFMANYIKQWSGFEATVCHPPVYGAGPIGHGNLEDGYVLLMNACAMKGLPIFTALAREFPHIQFAALPGYGTTSRERVVLSELPNVTTLENRPDVEEIFCRTRILLMPSLWLESFGLACVDAMLRGIPVLAADYGALPEAKLGTDYLLPVNPITEFSDLLDENGLPSPVIPEQDIGPWKRTLAELLNDKELLRRQSGVARRAAQEFVSGLNLCSIERLMEQVLSGERDNLARPQLAGAAVVCNDNTLAALTPEQKTLLTLWLKEAKSAE